ncbi:MAG: hypothetical protein MJ165_00260 [Alphaproteobacteria bacterium]|nr:hypothetical protein [Alphaproteobacteria bacterium]
MDTTLDILDEIGYLIKEFRGAYEDEGFLFGEEVTNIRRKLNFAIQDALDAKLISPKMAQEYIDVIHEIDSGRAGYDYTVDRIERLKEICNRQTEQYEQYDNKTTQAFDLSQSLSLVGLNDNVEDSKLVLQNVKQFMKNYEEAYKQNGAMESGDLLCAVGQAIQKGVADKEITAETAERLVDILKDMKYNVFRDNTHQDKIQEFMVVLNNDMSNIKDKDKTVQQTEKQKDEEEPEQVKSDPRFDFFNLGKKKPQQQDEQKPEAQDPKQAKPNDIFGGIKNAMAGQNKEDKNLTDDQSKKIALLIDGYEKAYKEAGSVKSPEVEESWKKLTDAIKEVVSSKNVPEDVARKLKTVNGMMVLAGNQVGYRDYALSKMREALGIREPENIVNQGQQPQEQKRQPLSYADLESQGRERIEAFKEKYGLSVETRKKYNKKQWEEILDQELGYSDIEDKYRKDFRHDMAEFYWKDPEIRDGVRVELPHKSPEVKTPINNKAEQLRQGIINVQSKDREAQVESKFRQGIENVNEKGADERRKKEMLKLLFNGKHIQNG